MGGISGVNSSWSESNGGCSLSAHEHPYFILLRIYIMYRSIWMPTKDFPHPHPAMHNQATGILIWDCPPWLDRVHGGLQLQIEHHLSRGTTGSSPRPLVREKAIAPFPPQQRTFPEDSAAAKAEVARPPLAARVQLFALTAFATASPGSVLLIGGVLETEGIPRENPLPIIDTAAPRHSTPLAAAWEGDGGDKARKNSGDRGRARSPWAPSPWWGAINNDYLEGGRHQ